MLMNKKKKAETENLQNKIYTQTTKKKKKTDFTLSTDYLYIIGM